jgi:hypothetical protein
MSTTSPQPRSSVRELALDVAVPLGLYFLLHAGLGMALVTALAISSIPPAVRTAIGVVREHELNPLAALILAVNLVGIATSFITGDARLIFAKDSAISSVIAFSILISAFAGRPIMTAGLKLFMTRNEADRDAAWERMATASARFRRLEVRYSLVWAVVLLVECAGRIVGAFTLPVSVMSWASTVFVVAAIAVAAIVSGALCAGEMEQLLERELEADAARPRARAEPMGAAA